MRCSIPRSILAVLVAVAALAGCAALAIIRPVFAADPTATPAPPPVAVATAAAPAPTVSMPTISPDPYVAYLQNCFLSTKPVAATSPDAAIIQRSVMDPGNTARLQRVFIKARRRQPITVAVIGGSITAGALASSPDKCYANRLFAWWHQQFPNTPITDLNAGIGATTSEYGALRAQRDLLSKHPDFVVIEFAVNDAIIPSQTQETMEGLIRQILSCPQQPAALLLFGTPRVDIQAEDLQAQVGHHYGLPMISYADVIRPDLTSKKINPDLIFQDDIHPNDAGHTLEAAVVTHYLATVRMHMSARAPLPVIAALPTPYKSDDFAHVSLTEGAALVPTQNSGWTYNAAGGYWDSSSPGSVIQFDIAGKDIISQTWRIKGAMGQASVQVDSAAPTTMDGWFSGTWGGYESTDVIAQDLTPTVHHVTFTLLPTTSPESTGHDFRIFAFGAAGVPATAHAAMSAAL